MGSVWLLVLLVTTIFMAPAQAQEIRVYVAGARSPEGFVSSQRVEDSAKDIRDVLSDKDHRKYINLLEDKTTAEVIIEVTESGNYPVAGGATMVRGIGGGIVAIPNAATLPGIKALIKIPGTEYSKELAIVQQMFWKDLAKAIVNQFDSWITSNITTIQERRKK